MTIKFKVLNFTQSNQAKIDGRFTHLSYKYFAFETRETKIFALSENENIICYVPFAQENSLMISHPNAFACGVIWASNIEVDKITWYIKFLVKNIQKYCDSNSSSFILKMWPNEFSSLFEKTNSIFLEEGFKVNEEKKTYVLDLNNRVMSSAKKRIMRKIDTLDYKIENYSSANFEESFLYLKKNYEIHGLQLPFSKNRLHHLMENDLNCKLFTLRNKDREIIGCAYSYCIYELIRVPIYITSRDMKNSTESLLEEIFKFYSNMGIYVFDLGTALDPKSSEEKIGIVNFKESLGARGVIARSLIYQGKLHSL